MDIMKKQSGVILAYMILVILLASAECAAENKTLMFVGNDSYPPISFQEGGKPKGLAIDIVRALGQRMGRQIDIRLMEWKVAQAMVAQGKADALCQLTVTEPRKQIYDFSDQAHDLRFSIFVRTGKQGINDLTDLRGLQVAVITASVQHQYVMADSQIKYTLIVNDLQGFQLLKDGKVDAVLADLWTGSYVLADKRIAGIQTSGEPFARLASAIAVKKGNTILLAAINDGLRSLQADGTIERINEKWRPQEIIFQTREQAVRKTYSVLIGILGLLLVVVAFWLITLKREISERRQAEEALRESEYRWKFALEGAGDGVWDWNVITGRVYFSAQWKAMLGYVKEDIGDTLDEWDRRVHPDDKAAVYADLDRHFRRETESYQNVHRVLCKDGTYKWILDRGKVIEWTEDRKHKRVIGTHTDITDRKQAEEALRQSNEQYRLLFENAGEGILLVQGYTIKVANPALEEILGYPRDIITTKPFSSFIHPDDRAMVVDHHMRRMRGEPMETGYRFRIITDDGTVRWLHIISRIISWEGVPASLSFVMDITDHKHVEDELRESEERYRNLFENASEAIFVAQDGNLVFLNSRTATQIGYSVEELKTKSFIDFIHPDDREKVIENHIKRMKGEELPNVYSFRIMYRDGSVRWAELSTVLIKWNGKPATLNFMTDITERKQAETVIQHEQALSKTIINSIPGTFYILNENGRYFRWNAYQRDEILGKPDDQMAGMNAIDTIHPEDRTLIQSRIANVLKDGKEETVESRVLLRGGPACIWMIMTGRRMTIAGRPHLVGTGIDITERKQTEKQLQDTLERLRKAVGTTIQVMVSAIESRDPYTSGHQVRSANLARTIATEMGLSQDKIEGIRMAGLIHDIGKLSIPAEILSKPTKLSEIEFRLIKEHAQKGYEMLKDVESPWPLAEIVCQHHERMDGSGYPRNLKGDDILMEARIMAVADVVEAIASHRPYRPSLGIDAALEEIEKNRGTLYDEAVVDACLRLFREKGFQMDVT